MKGKIVFIFSIIMLITICSMIFLMKSKFGSNDNLPLVFIGVFSLLLILFIVIIIKNKKSFK